MFIHFGLYSVLGRGEWAMYNEAIPPQEYHHLIDSFSMSEHFSVRDWVTLAKKSGAKYCVLTARHHEGFCLWNTSTTSFNSVYSPYHKDIVQEFVEACRDLGLKVGLYYSLLDWSDKGYLSGPKADPPRWNAFVEKVHTQIKELMSNYGKIDILWYDGFWPIDNPPYSDEIVPENWRATELNQMVRRMQPGILINDRSGIPEDFSTPEQEVISMGRAWEACMSSNDNWGFHSGDLNWKTPRQALGALVHSVSLGGNFIFNVGPQANGSIPAPAMECFETMGKWLNKNGSSIYGCTKPFHLAREALDGGFFCNSGIWTFDPLPPRLYYHILRWTGTELRVRAQGIIVDHVSFLNDGTSLTFSQSGPALRVYGLPASPPDELDTVLAVDYHPGQ